MSEAKILKSEIELLKVDVKCLQNSVDRLTLQNNDLRFHLGIYDTVGHDFGEIIKDE